LGRRYLAKKRGNWGESSEKQLRKRKRTYTRSGKETEGDYSKQIKKRRAPKERYEYLYEYSGRHKRGGYWEGGPCPERKLTICLGKKKSPVRKKKNKKKKRKKKKIVISKDMRSLKV